MAIEQVNSSQVVRPLSEPIANTGGNPSGNIELPDVGIEQAQVSRQAGVQGQIESNNTNVRVDQADNSNESDRVSRQNGTSSLSAEELDSKLRDAVAVANSFAQGNDSRLEFGVAGEPERQVVRVVNSENDELIRQIPSEEFIAISDRIRSINKEFEDVKGLLFNETI